MDNDKDYKWEALVINIQVVGIMSEKGTRVVIGGKGFVLSGYEQEHLNKVADYLNTKYDEANAQDSYKQLSYDMKSIYLQLNIADDYFKALDEIDRLKGEIEDKNNELYNMKHELVTAQIQVRQASKKQ